MYSGLLKMMDCHKPDGSVTNGSMVNVEGPWQFGEGSRISLSDILSSGILLLRFPTRVPISSTGNPNRRFSSMR
jgi:hypothetical protein